MTKVMGGLMLAAVILLTAAHAVSEVPGAVNWGAFTNPILDENGGILKDNCLVQLIWDADMDGVDEPGEGGVPSGGDRLVDESSTGAGSFFPGRFSGNAQLEELGAGERLYVRAWNAAKAEDATYFGDAKITGSGVWVLGTGFSHTLDATRNGSWSTNTLWSPEGRLLWRVERSYSGLLLQSTPNPFRGRTTVVFVVPGRRVWGMSDDGREMITYHTGSDRSLANLSVYDAAGRLVRVLTEEERISGQYSVEWDGTDHLGQPVPAGPYFVMLSVAHDEGRVRSLTHKTILVR